MNPRVKQMIVSISLVALTTGMATSAGAANDTSDLKPMLINAPILISAGAGWNGHWAQKDLNLLRTSINLQPDVLTSGATDPNEALPIGNLASVLLYMYRAGGEPGDALERAVKLGLVRTTDFATGQVPKDGFVSRELFALFLTRAIRVKGAEDSIPAQMAPVFVDASEIQPAYRAAISIMQAEGLLIGDGEGRFFPAQPLTYAQAARTMVKVSAWTQARAAKLAGLNPADANFLIEGRNVKLTGGVAEQPVAPGSASKMVTTLSDRQAAGDLNGDGEVDLAAVVISNSGGSGTFYYVTALLHDGTPVASAFLGDRIAVQNLRIVSGKVVVDLLTRSAKDAMVVLPHLKETRIFEVQNGALVPSV